MTSRKQNLPERRPGFLYREIKHGLLRRATHAQLHCEAIALPRLAEKYGTPGNYVNGANIAGFVKVADAMLDQGLV